MKKYIQNILAYFARSTIQKYNPVVIGITGSVGKTSAKEAIYSVVSQKFKARRPEKNFNNEFGLPLTILGMAWPGKNPLAWLKFFAQSVSLQVFPHAYPEVLVLELGVDRPGDMNHLLSIAKPHISIITTIGISHYEYFQSNEAIEREKGRIAEVLEPDEYLIVNEDNEAAARQRGKTKAKVLAYGSASSSEVRLVSSEADYGRFATKIQVQTPTRSIEASIKAIGTAHISSALAAIAVAESLKVETDLLLRGLSEYKPVPGRLQAIAGIKHTVILDDTYNASPDSTKAALAVLSHMPQPYKIAVLGDMLELGQLSDDAHRQIGKIVAESGITKLITVGQGGKLIADGAKDAGFDPEHIVSLDTSEQAQNPVQNLLVPESAILIKGSQGMRMEKITKEIMAEPMRAGELLCRQYGKWIK